LRRNASRRRKHRLDSFHVRVQPALDVLGEPVLFLGEPALLLGKPALLLLA
jgi:hypothetical protein